MFSDLVQSKQLENDDQAEAIKTFLASFLNKEQSKEDQNSKEKQSLTETRNKKRKRKDAFHYDFTEQSNNN